MKYLNFLRIAPLAIGLTVFVSACSTQDVFEPTPDPGIEEPEEPSKPSVNINWATHTTTVLNVDVNDAYNGQYYYTVEAFVGNPIVDANAKLISGSGQKTNTKVAYNRELVVPKGVESFFVSITDPFNRRWVHEVEAREGTITLDTATGNVTTKSLSVDSPLRSDVEYPTVDFTFDRAECIKVSGSNFTFAKEKSYLIEKGTTYSGTLSFAGEGKINLYVEGTLEASGEVRLQNGTNLYVLDGGVFKAKSGGNVSFNILQTSVLAVQQGGKLGEKPGSTISVSQITNQAKIVNEGDMFLHNVTTSNGGSLYNTSNLTVNGKILINSKSEFLTRGNYIATEMEMKAGSSFCNEGVTEITGKFSPKGGVLSVVNKNTLLAGEIDFANGFFENHCLVKTDKMSVGASGKVTLKSGSYIYSKDLYFANDTVQMDALSIWESETFTCKNNSFLHGSSDTDYALFKTNVFNGLGWNGFNITQDLQIEASTYTGKWKAASSVKMFEAGASTVVIPADECNDHTGNNNPAEGPGDTDETYEDGETLPYTYLFEDNWPAKGDYDMNDLVISVELRNTVKGAKTEKVEVIATLYAAGGTKVLAAGYQLDGVRAGSVSGGEDGQDYAVFHLFNDAHSALGNPEHTQTNTYSVTYEPQTIEQEVVFTTPIDGVINVNNFNLFLVLGGDFDQETRNEVHLPGFLGTNKASKSEFSTDDYIDIETGWMWGLAIPQTVFGTYPKENTPITDAYEGFNAWVTGSDTPDWYNFPVDGKVIVFEEASEEEL